MNMTRQKSKFQDDDKEEYMYDEEFNYRVVELSKDLGSYEDEETEEYDSYGCY